MEKKDGEKIQEERNRGAIPKVMPAKVETDEIVEIPDDIPAFPSHPPPRTASMENLYISEEENSSVSIDETLKAAEESVVDVDTANQNDGTPAKETRLNAANEQRPKAVTLDDLPDCPTHSKTKVAALKKRFEDQMNFAGKIKDPETDEAQNAAREKPVAPGKTFHDLSTEQKKFFSTPKLDAGEVKPSEEVLDVKNPDSEDSLPNACSLRVNRKESFQRAKRMFESNL